jgi:hypothetical protein
MIEPRRAIETLLEHRAGREARILEAVRDGARELGEIVRRAYADTPGADPGLAERQALAHLDRLMARGVVRRTGEGWTPVGG